MSAILESASRVLTKVNRKKTITDDLMETPLRRCLTTMDLLLLGIGHMVGAGIFVLTGTVVRTVAGPATLLSYMLAGVAATLSSLCYAEFGARVPKAGSAYTYTYVTMGELWAFVIGWNIILEHMLGVASVARAWSGSFDAIFDGAIKNGTLSRLGEMHGGPWLSSYPDFMALAMVLIVMVFIALGAKVSTNVNSVFTVINLVVIMLIICVGLSLSDSKNWTNFNHGGFFPYGFSGVFAGAATCYYAYIGFEGIAVAGEEAKHPEKSIPLATGFAMMIVSLLYIGGSAALTLMVPYYTVDMAAPFSMAFQQRGMPWARLAVSIGALFGISTSLIGGVFSLPRSVYAMASDGLFFRVFSHVHPRTQTPILAIVFFGVIAGLLALFVDINVLVEFLSIGTLLSFTLVAAGVLILRYQPAEKCQFKLKPEETGEEDDGETPTSDTKRILKTSQSHDDIGKLKERYINLPVVKNLPPGWATVGSVVIMAVFMAAFWILLLYGYHYVSSASWWALILLIIFITGIIAPFMMLLAHEQNHSFITFQVPLVPWIPSLSMFLNIAMMLKLNPLTWIRLAIWMSIGFFIYFLYGIRNSNENRPLSAYSHIVSYAGTSQAGLPEGALPEPGAGMVGPSPGQLLEEKLQPQQPRNELLRDISEEDDS